MLSPAAAALTHSQAEELIERQGREVLRQLLQGWLESRGPGDVGPTLEGRDGVRRLQRRLHSRKLESLFGTVQVERLGYGIPGQESLHPLDAELNLPEERYSHALRKKVAAEAARSSFEEVVEAIAEHTGGHVPKRQAEELCQRAAQDFDAFYAQRRAQPQAPQADASGAIVVLTTDGKGVPMRKEALRAQTRKAAEAGTHKLRTRLSKGEKRHRKRMATVASVYSIAPYVRRADDVVRELAPVREVRTERRPQPQGKRVWASVRKEPRAVIAEMFDEARGRDPEGQRPWVVLVDGHEHQLRLIRQEVKRRSVAVTLILDLFHVLEYLWAAAFAFHAEGSAEAEFWVRTQLLALLRGRVSQVAAAMRRSATVRAFTAVQAGGGGQVRGLPLEVPRYAALRPVSGSGLSDRHGRHRGGVPLPRQGPHGAHRGAVVAPRGRSGAASAGAVDEWGLRAVLGVSSAPRVRAQSCLTSGHGLPTEPHTAFQPGATPGDHQVNVVEKEPHPSRLQQLRIRWSVWNSCT